MDYMYIIIKTFDVFNNLCYFVHNSNVFTHVFIIHKRVMLILYLMNTEN